jgi:OOP family OmpA-OmpF porin
MRQTTRHLLLSALIAANLAPAAQAADTGWYLGAALGASRIDIEDSALPVTGATAHSLAKDETDMGFRGFVGYQFNPWLAVEGGYAELGEFNATRSVTAPFVGTASATGDVSGFNLDVVGRIPVANNWAIYGKAGVVRSTTKTSISTTGAIALAPGANANPEETENNLKYGLGFQYGLGKDMNLLGEWERYNNLGDSATTGEVDLNLFSIGLQIKF